MSDACGANRKALSATKEPDAGDDGPELASGPEELA